MRYHVCRTIKTILFENLGTSLTLHGFYDKELTPLLFTVAVSGKQGIFQTTDYLLARTVFSGLEVEYSEEEKELEYVNGKS